MKNIRVFIEIGEDGYYWAYMPDDDELSFDAFGEGNTPKEAQEDFLAVIEDLRQDLPEEIANLQFTFSYDIVSFLRYYSDKLTLAGLSGVTGITKSLLSKYITGQRRPLPQTVDKILASLSALGKDLSQIQSL